MERKKILIIEDEPDVAKLLAARLKGAGYETIITGEGIEGVKFAHKEKPDLIILDLILPAGNGLAVLENLKMSSYCRFIPVIVLTGVKEEEYKRRAIEKGADAYFEKPYEADKLLDSIKNLLGEKQG
jgi:DNA-binding response OmpR family regulator